VREVPRNPGRPGGPMLSLLVATGAASARRPTPPRCLPSCSRAKVQFVGVLMPETAAG